MNRKEFYSSDLYLIIIFLCSLKVRERGKIMNVKNLINNVTKYVSSTCESFLTLDPQKIKNSVEIIIANAINNGKRKNEMFIAISYELDMVVINIPVSQRTNIDGYTMNCVTVSCSNILTKDVEELPVSNGIYRARMKDGSFGYVAYYDGFLIRIPTCYRHHIRIRDPFLINLKHLNYLEYEYISRFTAENIRLKNYILSKENEQLKIKLKKTEEQLEKDKAVHSSKMADDKSQCNDTKDLESAAEKYNPSNFYGTDTN